MKDYLKKGVEVLRSVGDRVGDELSSGLSLVKERVDGLPIFVSSESSEIYTDIQYDEKHYFVIPYMLSEHKFALHTLRCLPKLVPEINDLPKRRVFHFPNEHSETMLKTFMLESARDLVAEEQKGNISSLESLADTIDALDKKLTYGMLLVGGLAAIANPLVGAGIAAKALLPSIGGALNKFGLRPTGEMLSKHQLDKSLDAAERHVIEQFEEANTLRVVNPILQELEYCLATTEAEHDPLFDPHFACGEVQELDGQRWRELTETAICHVYKEVYEDPSLHKKASLGPEDLRWLKVLYEVNAS